MTFFALAQKLFQSAPALRAAGFEPSQVEVYGKGADFSALLQIKKPSWRLFARDGEPIGYQAVEVHWESCRPGHWVLHCELWPRQAKARKDDARAPRFVELLSLKREITQMLRDEGQRLGWPESLQAHLKRARADAGDPSSLIVWTFDLGTEAKDDTALFVDRALRVLSTVSPEIDDIIAPHADRSAAPG
jgi:hypothetical protein